MNRQIKFRAWDGEKMLDCNQVPIGMLNKYETPPMQFTGLKDSKGREIYEGDVVYFEEPEFESDMIKAEVKFIDGRFSPFGQGLINPQNTKILGNIHESPELLTNK